MRNFLRVVIPTKLEIVFYAFIALLLLTAFVSSDLWHHLLNSANADPHTTETIATSLQQTINQFTHLSNPQIVNAVIWGATAAIALIMVGSITHFIRLIREDRSELGTRSGEIHFFAKLIIRIGSIIAIIVFTVLFLSIILPAILRTYEQGVLGLTRSWIGPVQVLEAVAVAFASLYFFAILCRLAALRLRVFSEVYE